MRRSKYSIISILLVGIMLFSVGCQNNASKSTVIETSTVDTSVEDINVVLEERERYTNPIPDEDQPYRDDSVEAVMLTSDKTEDQIKDDISTAGDPYVLRYNGKYYLYVSTNSWYCNYRVWESTDLVHYTYLGTFDFLDAQGKRTENDDSTRQGYDYECSYAPEVHYWNVFWIMFQKSVVPVSVWVQEMKAAAVDM